MSAPFAVIFLTARPATPSRNPHQTRGIQHTKKLISNLSTLASEIPNAYGNFAFLVMTEEQWKKRLCAIHNIDFNDPDAVLAAKISGTLMDKPVVTPPVPFQYTPNKPTTPSCSTNTSTNATNKTSTSTSPSHKL